MNKLIVKSLPTREVQCSEEYYNKCIQRQINEMVKVNYDCNMYPILPNNGASDVCSNEVATEVFETWKSAMTASEFNNCLNIQTCHQVMCYQLKLKIFSGEIL